MWGGRKWARTLMEQRQAALFSCTCVLCIDFFTKVKNGFNQVLGACAWLYQPLYWQWESHFTLLGNQSVGWKWQDVHLDARIMGTLGQRSQQSLSQFPLYKITSLSACLAEETFLQTVLLSVSWGFFPCPQLLKMKFFFVALQWKQGSTMPDTGEADDTGEW